MDPKSAQKQDTRKTMMLTEPIPRIIPRMAVPTIIAFLISSIYSLADTFFVSSLGTNATAAVSVNASLDQLIMMCGSMLAIGANSYIARLLGKGNEKKASQVLSTAFFSAFALGALLTVFGLLFMTPMVRFLGATPTCEQYAVEYATYVLLAAPFMASSFVMNQCLRSEGSATLSMIGMGFGGILNCFLDPLFIFTFDMGVAGASLATAISKWVSFAILIFPYLTRRSMLHLSIRNFRMAKDIITEIVTVGASSMFRSGLAVVSAIMLNDLAGNISDSVLAGIGVTNKIMMFPFSIILGFGNGFQPVAGFNWGAERYDRVDECYRFSSRVALIGGLAMAAVIAIFAEPIIMLFGGEDPEMCRIGALSIWLQCIALPVHAWVAMVNMFCTGLGNAGYALILATARQGSCFIPILYPLAINDAPALTRADIGIAIGAGADVAIDAADVVLMKSRLSDVPAAIRLSRATLRNIHQNLFWAFFYNSIGIPLAAGAFVTWLGWELNPMFGAAAMSLSSFCVVTNALRLNLLKIHDPSKDHKIRHQKKETKTMTKTMKIEGIMCGHCEARVKKALEALEAVELAEVSHTTGTAIVTLKAAVADDVLKAAVEAQDYPVISIQ